MSGQAFAPEQRVTRERPCPVCGKNDWCAFSADGWWAFCKRSDEWNGRSAGRYSDAGWHFRLERPMVAIPPRVPSARAKCASPIKAKVALSRPAPLERAVLDEVYRATAKLCGLDRFATDEIVIRREFPLALETGVPYFSLPQSGRNVARISRELVQQCGADILARVPGFGVYCKSCDSVGRADGNICTRCDGHGKQPPQLWSVRGERHDFAIIACDENGLAFWGTVRRLPFDTQNSGSKYLLLSSSRAADASIAGLPKYHVAGRNFPCDTVFVTEGILKAEIIASRLHCRVIGIYSTSIDQPTLAEVVRLAQRWNPSKFVIAFDADKHEIGAMGKLIRPGVAAGEQKLIDALMPLTDVYSAEWELSAGKGLDDLLTNGGTHQLVDRYQHPVPRPRVPRPCSEPGLVDGGDSIEVVRQETRDLILDRFGCGHRHSVTLIAPPPGTAKTGSVLEALALGTGSIAIGVSRHSQADELVLRASERLADAQPRRTA